ncbi:MAG: hypothetical protein ACRDJE_13230 [Dehalococcoidia bacterium]
MPQDIRAKVHSLTDDDIRERLLAFEKQFGMTSGEFLRRYNSGELGDNSVFIDWSGLLYIAAKSRCYRFDSRLGSASTLSPLHRDAAWF